MEARVYYNDGSIEACRIPDYVGNSSTMSQGDGSETYNSIDRVRGISERFVRDGEGYWLERKLEKPADVRLSADGTKLLKDKGDAVTRTCVVATMELPNVRLILLDGEQVYPEEAEATEDAYGY